METMTTPKRGTTSAVPVPPWATRVLFDSAVGGVLVYLADDAGGLAGWFCIDVAGVWVLARGGDA